MNDDITVRAIRAARALRKPNPTWDDELLYRDQGFDVGDGFEAALSLAGRLAEAIRSHGPWMDDHCRAVLNLYDAALIDGVAETPKHLEEYE